MIPRMIPRMKSAEDYCRTQVRTQVRADELLSKEFQAVSIIEEVIDQIDLMKKSILAKAFRGELGTNDSKEESSIELLKSILEK